RAGSADLFANELRSAVDLVARAPGAGRGYLSEALPGARRVPLHRTRFHIYYVQREDVVVVVAVWSAVRGEGPPLTSLGSTRRPRPASPSCRSSSPSISSQVGG